MSFMSAIVLIAVILCVTVLAMQSAENRKERRLTDEGERRQEIERERDEAQAELADLRERVKVLERIATDPARRTAEEIESLRDEQDR
ncbi:hypothetical protein [Qipengyuania atrilutea]|uniref:Uncharacterized protein n=1 Tax=Qipengyuania atrilutea TaxID=2744473 RepID=A0A850GZL5_9SPHN|nr:hypothetical protein [Actirhodobacter atriluteus]NVD43442.1 hypothetical protein [Actirhodobacter atriluteus]